MTNERAGSAREGSNPSVPISGTSGVAPFSVLAALSAMSGRVTRAGRAGRVAARVSAVLAVLAVLVGLTAGSPAAVAGESSASGAAGSAGSVSAGGGSGGSGSSSVTLVGQSPWVVGTGPYNFHLQLPGAVPGARLEVRIFDQMTTRTGFQAAAGGHIYDRYFYDVVLPVSSLSVDAQGGYDVVLPVNQAAAAGNPFRSPVYITGTGVYPVQFTVFDQNGANPGSPLVSFITFVQQSVSAGQITPISAALVIPVATTPTVGPGSSIGAPSPSEVTRLSDLAAVLRDDPSVPATLQVSPLTIDQLAASNTSSARQALAALSTAGHSGNYEILPSTYAPVALEDLSSAALQGEVDQQLAVGSQTLAASFGTAPGTSTWLVNGPLDAATFAQLVAHHATRVMTPEADLTALSNPGQITFAWPTVLSSDGQAVQSVAADSGLSADFTRTTSPVLGANELLAELAMIYSEAPNAVPHRGVAIVAPASWSASPVFVQTLLEGLHGDPLVTATTATGLFTSIGSPQGYRGLAHPQQSTPEPFLEANARTIERDRTAIANLGHVFAGERTLSENLQKRLLLAESPDLTAGQRQSILAVIGQATAKVYTAATLPPATSITLTATRSQLPVTVLTQASSHPYIEVVMQSPHLAFRPFQPPNGTCGVINESTEVCTLTLMSQNTTLKVPVETRSSGVFPLYVSLLPPGTPYNSSDNLLVTRKDTIRSTAVSGVALILIGVAGLALIFWWGRDLRRGRRPKGMVPAPEAADADDVVTAGDPLLDAFFDLPPPGAETRAMSPSPIPGGPSPTTHLNGRGRGRETRR